MSRANTAQWLRPIAEARRVAGVAVVATGGAMLVGRFLAFRGRALQFPGVRGFLPREGRETARVSITIWFPSMFPCNSSKFNMLKLSGFP
jgi:hypothetical protein